MRVTIDEALNEDAALPIPTDDCQSIGDGVGSHVMWPVHLLKLKDEKSQKKKIEEAGSTIDMTNVPKQLRVLYCYCKVSLQSRGTIAIRVDSDLFGHERTLYIHLQDVKPFCQLLPISYTCIVVYIWFLFKKMKLSHKVDKFRFVDPYNIGHIPSTKNDKQSIDERLERRSRDLAERLVGTLPNQIVLVPCNVGEHWILTVIDPYMEDIGILDPLYKGIHDATWKQVVNMALKMFNAAKEKKGRKMPRWNIIKVPKQPDGFQCGYFVMKYLSDVVEFDGLESISSLQSLFNKRTYSIADIDSVRMEWADCVQDYMYA